MKNGGFEVLDHPADMGLLVWSETKSSLFQDAALAVMSVLVDLDTVKDEQERHLFIEGPDMENAMYQFLSEVLFYFDAEKFLLSSCTIVSFVESESKISLELKLHGERFRAGNHQLKTYVKAITYHQLQVFEQEGKLRARIFLDI